MDAKSWGSTGFSGLDVARVSYGNGLSGHRARSALFGERHHRRRSNDLAVAIRDDQIKHFRAHIPETDGAP
jgi:hypothetical protein